MRRAGSGLTDPDATKNKLDNYARVAQHALKWQASPVHWRGLNRAIIGYCTQNKQPVPDWKGCGFTQLKPFLMHLAGQNRIRFVGDHIVHPDNEDGSVDIVGYDEDENSEDAEESIVPAQLNRSTSSTVVTHAKAISSPKLNKSSSFSKSAASSGKLVPCPVCQSMMAEEEVNRHLDECLNLQMLNNEQNGANNAASNTAAVPNTNPRTTAAVAAGTLLSQLTGADEDEVVNLAHTRRGHRGAAIHLGKRRRSAPGGRAFAPNKRARIFYENHEEDEDSSHSGDSEEEAQEEDRLVNNNNNRLRFVPEVQQNIPAVPVNNQTHHVHLSDDSDDEDNANNAQGGGDSRFAEKILDRTLADKECIICYMAMEKGQLVVTMPCFCQFHKECLLDWFSKREVCPTHSEMSM